MTHKQPISFFENKVKELSVELASLTEKHKKLSFIRILLFLLVSTLIVYFANQKQMDALVVALFVGTIVFILLIRLHNSVSFHKSHTGFLLQINKEEIHRLQANTSSINDGMQFFDKDHFYAPDLDLFGSNSLFQFISRSRVPHAQSLLTSWLLNPSNKDIILSRQEAIKELTPESTWRQSFTAYGMMSEESIEETEALLEWLDSKDSLPNLLFWKIASILMPVISLILIGMIIFSDTSFRVLFIPILINLGLLGATFNRLQMLMKGFEYASKSLKSYKFLIQSIEEKDFESSMLQKAKKSITGEHKASKAISALGGILHQLHNRINVLYIPFNIVFALDLYWLTKAEKWKATYGTKVNGWFQAVYHIDALSDMAAFAFANPSYSFPEISEQPCHVSVEEMGHPMIHPDKRISNNFHLSSKGQLGLVTGSNMSGKSTFLRTLGVNLVLAQTGAPVCAKTMSCSITQVFTSMRTQDNLEESISSFYAELARIKKLLDTINDETPIFYLLDEILKGTNSDDRHKGAIALIQQLTSKNAIGLISTHDLSLSKLESENEKVHNYSFNSEIIDDDIVFNYQLTLGPCKSFNASKLMEKMGIIV